MPRVEDGEGTATTGASLAAPRNVFSLWSVMTLVDLGKMVSVTGPVGAPGPARNTDSALVRLLLKQIVVQFPSPLL